MDQVEWAKNMAHGVPRWKLAPSQVRNSTKFDQFEVGDTVELR